MCTKSHVKMSFLPYKKISQKGFAFSQKGFTFVELVVVIAILLVLLTTVSIFVRPAEQSKKARDNIRLSDMSILERSISEFVLDNKRYPDQVNVLRIISRCKWLNPDADARLAAKRGVPSGRSVIRSPANPCKHNY